MLCVSLAIPNSSLVGITNTRTLEPGLLNSFSLILRFLFSSSSISIPKKAKCLQMLARRIASFSPIPAVKTIASTPFHGSYERANVFCALYTQTFASSMQRGSLPAWLHFQYHACRWRHRDTRKRPTIMLTKSFELIEVQVFFFASDTPTIAGSKSPLRVPIITPSNWGETLEVS